MVQINQSLVKDLRERTSAGIMDCKKALEEKNGDIEAAIEYLRQKGISKAAKKSVREASEGCISSYIHAGGKLGVLVEVNCETDFVAKTEDYKELSKDIAMHIAAMNPIYIKREDIPLDVLEKEKNIYREQIATSGKPANVIEKIVQGKIEKYYTEVCLLEQPFVKIPEKSIQELITEKISKLGENIVVKRFVRFKIGEN